MKNKTIAIVISLILVIIGILFATKYMNKNNFNNTDTQIIESKDESSNKNMNNDFNNNINIEISGTSYILTLEDNATTRKLYDVLPIENTFSDLNNNEKYLYLDYNLPTNSYNPGKINKGDVLLYGDNCLVIFYKSFNTNYSYTKIGHIENLNDLDNLSVNIKITK